MEREFGSNHKKGVNLVVLKFDLDELMWLQSIIPEKDAFRRDVRQAIEWLEVLEDNTSNEQKSCHDVLA